MNSSTNDIKCLAAKRGLYMSLRSLQEVSAGLAITAGRLATSADPNTIDALLSSLADTEILQAQVRHLLEDSGQIENHQYLAVRSERLARQLEEAESQNG